MLVIWKVVYDVCDIIVERGVWFLVVGIVGILMKINRCGDLMFSCFIILNDIEVKKIVIVIDGSLYEKYFKFWNYMEDVMKEMLGEDYVNNVIIILFKDGLGVGVVFFVVVIFIELWLGDVGVIKW